MTPVFRVVKVRRVKSPDHWGVQRRVGYTDGKPSYRLVQRFWRKSDAVAFAVLSECGLNTDDVLVKAKEPVQA